MTFWTRLPAGHVVAGRFVLQDRLGRGRSAVVYRAVDRQTRTSVALKVLDPMLAREPASLARFEREVAALRALDHPNVVRVYDVLHDGDLHVICMELVDGVDASRWLERVGRLSVPELVRTAEQIVAAVEACHRRGVLHRDLKPQNVLVTARGDVKLVDFGVARVSTTSDLTQTGTALGSVAYMAPEQLLSSNPDLRSDVYALGVVFYELLVGRLPRNALERAGGDAPPLAELRSDVPPWLDAVIMRCLAFDPDRRYQSATALRVDLARGARAQALAERTAAPPACLACGASAVSGLPFCHGCGVMRTALFAPGPAAVVVDQCEDPARLCDEISRLTPVSSPRALRRSLEQPPVVLCRGVSRDAAAALVGECARVPGELRVVGSLLREFRMPRLFYALALLMLIPLITFETVSGRLGVAAAAMAVLSFAYWWQVRPLIRLRSTGSEQSARGALVGIAAAVKGYGQPGVQAVVGRVVGAALRVETLAQQTPCGLERATFERLVRVAVDAGASLAGHESHLARTTLADLKAQLDGTELQLGAAADSEALIRRRSELRRAIADHRAIEDMHTRLHVGLSNLCAVLEETEEALRAHRPADLLAVELARLEGVLREPATELAA